MNRRRSLAQVLARQWIVFGLVLFAGFGLMSVLMLYVLEDRFIDRRLRDTAQLVTGPAQPPALPPRFELMPVDGAAPEVLDRMRGLRPGAIREFRLADGRYLHVLSGRDREGRPFLLGYDVSDQLNVNAALAQGWPWLLAVAALLALLAYGLARRFVGRVARQASGLLARVAEADGPGQLHALAEEEAIHEFSELARLSAEAWESRLAALVRERETLAFLGHELRTPLQSARTSLALLNGDRGNAVAWQRLQRAQDRLARASHAILWLAASGDPDAGADCLVAPVADALAVEFAPLAGQRQQVLECRVDEGTRWPLPPEVVEIVLANLLLNAIQHGGPGDIHLQAHAAGLQLANPDAVAPAGPGFGLGLELVQRLLERFGWALRLGDGPGHVVRVGPASPR